MTTGIWQQHRIVGDLLHIIPAPDQNEFCVFEYISKNWNVTSVGNKWVSDQDSTIWDDELITLGVMWRWKKMKGQDYSEEFREFENAFSEYSGRDGGRMPVLSMGADRQQSLLNYAESSWTGPIP